MEGMVVRGILEEELIGLSDYMQGLVLSLNVWKTVVMLVEMEKFRVIVVLRGF